MNKTQRPRALVIEDEGIVLLELEFALRDLGYDVVGCANNIKTGEAMASHAQCDVAVIDFNLGGQESTPIADSLHARGIPFVFVTGYTNSTLPDRHAHLPLVSKPYSLEQLDSALRCALRQG